MPRHTIDGRLSNIFYSTKGYWKGFSAVEKLADAAKVSRKVALSWLRKQALWQIYLPAPHYIPRPKFDVTRPNAMHQADLLFLPHDRFRGKTYRYALTIIDVASRYKEAIPVTSKNSVEIADAFERAYKKSKLKWPDLIQVDPGREFMGAVSVLFAKHNVTIKRGAPGSEGGHRGQSLVERLNRSLSERLFGHQYAQELKLPENERSTTWVSRLNGVIAAMNNETTRLTSLKPSEAIKQKTISSNNSTPYKRPIGKKEHKLPPGVVVRFLYQNGELEGGSDKRATDPNWSLSTHSISRTVTKNNTPVMYYLNNGPKRCFVREELMIVPPDTQLPPDGLLSL